MRLEVKILLCFLALTAQCTNWLYKSTIYKVKSSATVCTEESQFWERNSIFSVPLWEDAKSKALQIWSVAFRIPHAHINLKSPYRTASTILSAQTTPKHNVWFTFEIGDTRSDHRRYHIRSLSSWAQPWGDSLLSPAQKPNIWAKNSKEMSRNPHLNCGGW